MDAINKFQKRPLSFSNYTEYINPERAHQALIAHHHREWRSNKRYEDSYKTVMCQNWLERAQCSFGKNCRFAHGFDDLRTPTLPLPINDKYKTRLCEKYTSRGICPYGSRCLFIHPEHNEFFSSNNQTKKKTKNLFPQILEQLNREKENQQPADPMQLEMERIVERLIASPF